MRIAAGMVVAGTLFLSGMTADADSYIGADFGVFCVRGRLVLDQRRIEELKSVHGDDVCRLDQDATEAGARAKVERLGGIGASCTCP